MWRRIAAFVGAVALVATACGGNGETRLSASEWRQQADAICEEGDERVDSLGDQFVAALTDTGGVTPEAEAVFGQILDEIGEQIDRLRDLSPPEVIQPDVDDWLDEAERVVADLEDRGARSAVEDLLLTGEQPFSEANRRARDLGLGECGDEDDDIEDPAPIDEIDEPDDTAANVTVGGRAGEAFVAVAGWSYAPAPAGTVEQVLAELDSDEAELLDSIDGRVLVPDDGSSGGALILSFALDASAGPFAQTFRQGVLESIAEDGAETEDATYAGREAVFVDASATAGFVAVFWQEGTLALFFLADDRAAVEAAAEALLGALD